MICMCKCVGKEEEAGRGLERQYCAGESVGSLRLFADACYDKGYCSAFFGQTVLR